MNTVFFSILAVLSLALAGLTQAPEPKAISRERTPLLVELFTSEGCSTCPPADVFLQKLDQQPISGEEMIVLGEHVDYWNHIGWKDPYSSRFYSDRQTAYAKRFGLDSVYTPQIVVDGTTEFVGSDEALAHQAFAKELGKPKLAVRLSSVYIGATNLLQAHLETDALPGSFGVQGADVYVAVALNRAESQVARGENAGRTLTHVAVVRSMVKVGTLRQGQVFIQNIRLKLDPGTDTRHLRLIAFLQEPNQGRVIGATMQPVGAETGHEQAAP
jgi:hypothetical protein